MENVSFQDLTPKYKIDFKLNKCGNAKLKCTFGPDTSYPNGFQMGQSFHILKPPEANYLVFQERRYI